VNQSAPLTTEDRQHRPPISGESGRRQAVARLRRVLERADPGTLAALRRIRSGGDPPAAFYRVTVDALEGVVPEDGPGRDRADARWAIVASAMANALELLAPIPFGQALAEAGVSEMRVHIGPGYRVYFVRTGTTIYVLLVGGDKSTQKQDVARAKKMARELKETK